jgi:hypothetical protein
MMLAAAADIANANTIHTTSRSEIITVHPNATMPYAYKLI